MREKYYIRSEDGMVLGLSYDADSERIAVGGPWRFRGEAVGILAEYFGASGDLLGLGLEGRTPGRVRLVSERPEWAWTRGLVQLKRDYVVKATRSFNRLCR